MMNPIKKVPDENKKNKKLAYSDLNKISRFHKSVSETVLKTVTEKCQ